MAKFWRKVGNLAKKALPFVAPLAGAAPLAVAGVGAAAAALGKDDGGSKTSGPSLKQQQQAQSQQRADYTLNDIYKTAPTSNDYDTTFTNLPAGWNGDTRAYGGGTVLNMPMGGKVLMKRTLKPGVQEAIDRNKAIQARQTGYETRQIDPGYQADLLAASRGQAPSAAELMLSRQAGQDVATQYALANSARGGYNPLFQREAQRGAADVMAKRNEAAAILRAQEQAQARQAYGQYVLGQQTLGDTMSRGVMGDVTQRDVAAMGGTIELNKQRQAYELAQQQIAMAKTQAEREFWQGIIGSVLSAGGAVGSAFAGAPSVGGGGGAPATAKVQPLSSATLAV